MIKKCALCGTAVEMPVADHHILPDEDAELDFRNFVREIDLSAGVVCCPKCGYCQVPALFDNPHFKYAERIVDRPVYRKQLENMAFSDLQNYYLCMALILRPTDVLRAGMYSLHAAWVCDDEGYRAGGIRCRELAAADFLQYIESRLKSIKNLDFDDCLYICIYVDICRRSGYFGRAILFSSWLLTFYNRGFITVFRRFFRYEMYLSMKRDKRKHRLSELEIFSDNTKDLIKKILIIYHDYIG